MEKKRVGFFICHCGGNISKVVDIEAMKEYASSLPGVETVYDYMFVCSETGQATIKERVKELGLNRVVVASCTPKFHEPTFRRTISEVGLNPYFLAVCNIREHCSFPHSHDVGPAQEKAKALIRGAVARAMELEPISVKKQVMNKDVLVIGAGVAGIQASLELADAGFRVFLLEREAWIGGNILRLSTTFPNEEETMPFVLPLMDKVSINKNIEIITLAHLRESSGTLGNFEVKFIQRPRFVDTRRCTGCGKCLEVCEVAVPDTYDAGLRERPAIYFPTTAFPRIPRIDEGSCVRLKGGEECNKCQETCPTGAITFSDKEKEITLYVGAIIVATGFKEYDPTKKGALGYGRYKDVITQLQLARLIAPLGPTKGRVLRPSDGEEPRRIVMIQCVGSRDDQPTGHPYCSRVCCMVAAKHASLLRREKIPGCEITICYMDIRAFGKGYEEYYKRAQSLGVRFLRGRVAEVWEEQDKTLRVRVENTLNSEVTEIPADLVVLSCAMEPSDGTQEVIEVLGIGRDESGFVKEFHPKLRPCDTTVEGIFIAGCVQGPKDVQDSIAQGSGSASRVESFLSGDVSYISLEKASSDETKCKGCKVCLKICVFDAIEVLDTPKGRRAYVNEAICHGCGACAAACPTGAMQLRHYKDNQVVAEVEALLMG